MITNQVAIGSVIGFIVMVGAISQAPGPTPAETIQYQEQDVARRTIDLCWQTQEKKSLEPATARFVAGTCEMAEERYQQKFGRKYVRR